MLFRKFRIVFTIKALLLCALALAAYVGASAHYYAITALSVPLWLVLLFSLIRSVETSNKKLAQFLDSIRYSDFSQSFIGRNLGPTFNELNTAFQEVIKKFRQTRIEKEEQYRYLQTVIQHVGVGVIIYKNDETVDLVNQSARRQLGIRQLSCLQHLEKIAPDLPGRIRGLKRGERILVKITRNERLLNFVVAATDFMLQDQRYRLLSIQNIQSELDEQEMDAWQKLIRILTHEIMNSITPIVSLASTTRSMLAGARFQDYSRIDPDLVNDINNAISTIEKRSHGLMAFVENYRQLTRIPKPDFKMLNVNDLVERVLTLFHGEMESHNIHSSVQLIPPKLGIMADPDLIEQVLINLVKNAIEALADRQEGQLRIKGFYDEFERAVLQVVDNGCGISPENIDKIFVPFFTTKPNGSGIGLSLSRQIMRLHGGSLQVQCEKDSYTCFTLRFS